MSNARGIVFGSTFQIQEKDERRLLSCVFEWDAAMDFGSLASFHCIATAYELWYHLESQISNKAQLNASQEKFFSIKWNVKYESVSDFV